MEWRWCTLSLNESNDGGNISCKGLEMVFRIKFYIKSRLLLLLLLFPSFPTCSDEKRPSLDQKGDDNDMMMTTPILPKEVRNYKEHLALHWPLF